MQQRIEAAATLGQVHVAVVSLAWSTILGRGLSTWLARIRREKVHAVLSHGSDDGGVTMFYDTR